MKPCWVFMILVGCSICDATQEQKTCTCNDKLKSVCVPAGHNVSVPCPTLSGQEFRYYLHKDQGVIYNHTCSHSNEDLNCTPPTRGDLQLQKNTDNASVSFLLVGVSASNHGVYRCASQVRVPPPLLLPVPGDVGILVLLEGHQCACKEDRAGGCGNFFWIWIVVLVAVVLYSVVVTVSAVFFWVKVRNMDSQSDYMNTKPRAPRGQRKNRGVQNPMPRYF